MSMATTLVERALRQRTISGRLAFETFLVIGGAIVVALMMAGLSRAVVTDSTEAHTALAVLAACTGAAAVALGQTAGKLSGNRRAEWVIPALALYSAVVVPSTALPTRPEPEALAVDASSVVTFTTIVLLLLAAIRPPERLGARFSWTAAIGTALLAVALDEVSETRSTGGVQLEFPVPVGAAIMVLWWSVSTAVVVAGYCTASAPLWRVGLGFGVIAAAHLLRSVWPQDLAENGLVFAALRLLGTVVVLLGVAQLLRRALSRVISERFSHQEDLRLAGIRVEQLTRDATRRDHELRNCLTGLSGLSTMLDRLEVGGPQADARSAVRSELARMSELLAADSAGSVVEIYDVARVVREITALWQAAGMRIDATVPSELVAVGRPASMAQALTNLLANCARYAPGSPVTVVARPTETAVAIQVSDHGPQAGAPMPAGSGIGLSLSRRLLEAEGGRLRILTSDHVGFTALVELTALPTVEQSSDVVARSAVGS